MPTPSAIRVFPRGRPGIVHEKRQLRVATSAHAGRRAPPGARPRRWRARRQNRRWCIRAYASDSSSSVFRSALGGGSARASRTICLHTFGRSSQKRFFDVHQRVPLATKTRKHETDLCLPITALVKGFEPPDALRIVVQTRVPCGHSGQKSRGATARHTRASRLHRRSRDR